MGEGEELPFPGNVASLDDPPKVRFVVPKGRGFVPSTELRYGREFHVEAEFSTAPEEDTRVATLKTGLPGAPLSVVLYRTSEDRKLYRSRVLVLTAPITRVDKVSPVYVPRGLKGALPVFLTGKFPEPLKPDDIRITPTGKVLKVDKHSETELELSVDLGPDPGERRIEVPGGAAPVTIAVGSEWLTGADLQAPDVTP